jgi:hypothetical protein
VKECLLLSSPLGGLLSSFAITHGLIREILLSIERSLFEDGLLDIVSLLDTFPMLSIEVFPKECLSKVLESSTGFSVRLAF